MFVVVRIKYVVCLEHNNWIQCNSKERRKKNNNDGRPIKCINFSQMNLHKIEKQKVNDKGK